MTVAVQIDDGIIVGIKEDQIALQFRVVDLVHVDIQGPAHRLAHFFLMAGLVQTGVAFQYVEQGVHGLVRHDTVFRELFVGFRLPVDGEGFQISDLIGAVVLDQVENAQCQFQSFLIAGQPVIGTQCVQCKGLVVGMFGGIQRFAIIGQRPVDAAVFLIHTVLGQKTIRVIRRSFRLRIIQEQCGLGEEPEDAAVQDAALFGLRIYGQIITDVAIESTICFIF